MAQKTPASKHGFRYFANELRILEEMYRDGPTNPRQQECENLAWTFTTQEQRVQAGLPVTWRQIKTWFDNRRQKDRREALGKKLPPRVRKKKDGRAHSTDGSDQEGDRAGAEQSTMVKLETMERMKAFNGCDTAPARDGTPDTRMQRAAVRDAVRVLKDADMSLQELQNHLAEVGSKLEDAPLMLEGDVMDILRTAVDRATEVQPPAEEGGGGAADGGAAGLAGSPSFGRSTSFGRKRALTRSSSKRQEHAASPPATTSPASGGVGGATGGKLSDKESEERFDRAYADFNKDTAPIVDDLRASLDNGAADEVLLQLLRAFKERMQKMMDEVTGLVDQASGKALMDHARQHGMWVGGLEPSVTLYAILPAVEGELTPDQLERIENFIEEVEEREYNLSCALDALVRSADTVNCIDKNDSTSAVALQAKVMARTLSGLGTAGITGGVESILKHADQLRLDTLDKLGEVLTAKQSAKAVLATVTQRNQVRIAAAFLGRHLRL